MHDKLSGMVDEPAMLRKKKVPTIPESHPAEEPSLQTKKRPNVSLEQQGVMEPPLQRRRKPLSVTQPAPPPRRDSDYVLLGNQEKFTTNVRYQPKRARTVVGTDACGELYAHIPELPTPSTPPPAPRPLAPPPKVAVDTGAPVKHQSRAGKSVSTSTHERVVNGERQKIREPPPKKPQMYNQGPKTSSGPAPKISNGPAPKHFVTQGPKKSEQLPKKSTTENKTNPKPTDRPKTKPVAKQDNKMMEKERGQTDVNDRATTDYALQYQMGVAPRRPHPPTRLSEYQVKYRWLSGEPAAPLIAAEQVVHKSQAAPPSLKGAPRLSEYRRQFQDYKYTPVEQPGDQAKPKRSRSLDALHEREGPPAGTAKVTSPEDRRLLLESMNPLKIHFPHGKHKRLSSEYASNFIDPTRVSYVEGAWRGSAPPQINTQQAAQLELEDESSAEAPPVGNWFSEVVELRKKADEYRTRARGTHFSRAHLAQLYHTQNAEFWDSHSTLSALSLEAPPSVRSMSVKEGSVKSVQEAWPDKAPPTKHTPTHSEVDYSIQSFDDGPPHYSATGRITTPEIRLMNEKPVRHHLDRTTPNMGGALLTSPTHTATSSLTVENQDQSDDCSEVVARQQEPVTKPKVGRHRDNCTMVNGCSCATQTAGDQLEQSTQIDTARLMKATKQKTRNVTKQKTELKRGKKERKEGKSDRITDRETTVNGVAKLYDERSKVKDVGQVTAVSHQQDGVTSAPTYGMPTRDTHVLLDENTPEDQPLKTTYVHMPRVDKVPLSGHLDFPGAVEGNLKPTPEVEDDAVSVRSFASSCSMASQVLERARQRRDEFWDKNGHVRQ